MSSSTGFDGPLSTWKIPDHPTCQCPASDHEVKEASYLARSVAVMPHWRIVWGCLKCSCEWLQIAAVESKPVWNWPGGDLVDSWPAPPLKVGWNSSAATMLKNDSTSEPAVFASIMDRLYGIMERVARQTVFDWVVNTEGGLLPNVQARVERLLDEARSGRLNHWPPGLQESVAQAMETERESFLKGLEDGMSPGLANVARQEPYLGYLSQFESSDKEAAQWAIKKSKEEQAQKDADQQYMARAIEESIRREEEQAQRDADQQCMVRAIEESIRREEEQAQKDLAGLRDQLLAARG